MTDKLISIAPRGLSRSLAAEYVGVGVTLFDELVAGGAMPKPFPLGRRRLWDRRAIDSAIDNLVADNDNTAGEIGFK
jgi:predicted DNA-binding transcriptional regulator AlpA